MANCISNTDNFRQLVLWNHFVKLKFLQTLCVLSEQKIILNWAKVTDFVNGHA